MASKVEPKILAAAVDLFADRGYYGVTTRDLARAAETSEGSLYRLFGSKEKLFEDAVKSVIDRSLDPGEFLMAVFDSAQAGKQGLSKMLETVLRQWYNTLGQKPARLLTQAYFVKSKLRRVEGSPYAPVDKVIEILGTMIDREHNTRSAKLKGRTAAMAIILALLHFKITLADSCSSKQETEIVDSFVGVWLEGLLTTS